MTYGDYPDLSSVKKILVVKLRHLGDVLLTGAVFNALRIALPESSIDAYIYEEAKPMLEGHPALRHLIGYDRDWKRRGWFARLRQEAALLRQIRSARYDLVINLTEGDRGAFAAKISAAPIRVGFTPKGRWQKGLYTHIVKHCPSLRHTVEKNLDAVRRIGIFPEPEERELFFHIPPSALASMRDVAGEGFILIHPSSRWRFKCYAQAKMRQLIEHLVQKGRRIVLTSGPDAIEKEMVRELAQGLNVLDLSGKISLKELGALIQLSEQLICVDSVPLHIASALKKKVVALFGPTSEVTWGPWRNPQARIVTQNLSCRPCYQDGCGGSKYADCLQTLPLEAVLRAVETTESRGLFRNSLSV